MTKDKFCVINFDSGWVILYMPYDKSGYYMDRNFNNVEYDINYKPNVFSKSSREAIGIIKSKYKVKKINIAIPRNNSIYFKINGRK